MKLLRLLMLALAVLVALTAFGPLAPLRAQLGERTWPGCDHFPTQEVAQQSWKAMGSPESVGGGADGQVCESLPSLRSAGGLLDQATGDTGSDGARSTDCRRPARPVVVMLSRARYPQTTLHIEQAVRMGQPRVLTIERSGTEQKRADWQRVVPQGWDSDRDGTVDDRDEWPVAMSAQGGRDASIALVDAADNRGAGSVIGNRLGGYCDGTRFQVRPYGQRGHATRILIAADHGRRLSRWVSAAH